MTYEQLRSGIKDEALRQHCKDYLESLPPETQRLLLSRIMVELFLSDEALALGYGWEDATGFGRWLDQGCEP
jgi:hypothetical protein